MMTSAERFVVAAGVTLLVLNVLLFSFCLALVLDSQATRNENAQLLALTHRMLENQEATTPSPSPSPTTTTTATTTTTTTTTTLGSSRPPATAEARACPSFVPQVTVVAEATTETSSEEPDSEGTESGAVTETPEDGILDDYRLKFNEKLKDILGQIEALKDRLDRLTNTSESSTAPMERRRR